MKPFWALVVRQEVNSVRELKGKVMGFPDWQATTMEPPA
jgi:hypothetical protein